jgi:hypothetical protein
VATRADKGHTLWVDGIAAGTWSGNDVTTSTHLFLGRNGANTVDNGTVTIDYVRFDTTGAYAPPVPPLPDTTRASSDFQSVVESIEGDSDPAALSSFENYGTPNITVNGDGTITWVLPSDAYPAWGWSAPSDFVSSAVGWTWETRFRIDSANVANRGVWEIFIRDRDSGSLSATRIHFLSSGLDRDTAGVGVNAEIAADLTDDFHVVRAAIEPDTNLTTVWLDGEKVIDALVSQSYSADEFCRFGRWGGQTRGGTVTIDYIRLDSTGAYEPPVPMAGTLMTIN